MAGLIENGVVRRNELVGPSIYLMQIELPETARKAKPGQFIHIKINDGTHLLRRPISIAGADIKRRNRNYLSRGGYWNEEDVYVERRRYR